MSLEDVRVTCRSDGLAVVGAFHPGPDDLAPKGCETLVLLGADGEALWTAFSASPEAGDGDPDPMDRWSRRTISSLADRLGAAPVFPFGGPPYAPFQRWAVRGERARPSPVALLVTPERGLWTSYRGALAFPVALSIDPPADLDPCLGCPAPCQSACPVDAFSGGTYRVADCASHATSAAGSSCRDGCLVRTACPAGEGLALPKAQKAFHMAAFLKAHA